MISSLRGTVLHASIDSVVIDVGGVGFSVAVPAEIGRSTLVGATLALHTNLIVREDALLLFGFATREELDVFGQLLGVTGVGPKSALGVLSEMSIDQIAQAVHDDDDKPFRKVTGIGPKTAKLLVVQLAGKLAPPTRGVAMTAGTTSTDVAGQVVQALVGLGWAEKMAIEAVSTTAEHAAPGERDSVAVLLRMTLAALGPARSTRG